MKVSFSTMNTKVFAYISTTFGFGIMNYIFGMYYTKFFLEIYGLKPEWYNIAQCVYMVWNAINDPLFGYFQDNCKWKIFRKRRFSILFGAPFYGLSFLVAWIPFSNDGHEVPQWVIGVHLIAALCLYDTMFTFVLLAHCCLVTEMELDFQNRFNIKWWSVIASLCASLIVPLMMHASDNLKCLPCFRFGAVIVAIVATICMIYTGLYAHTVYDTENIEESNKKEKRSVSSASIKNVFKLTGDILKLKDFHGFVWLNFLHQGHSAFQSNFVVIFMQFLSPGLSSSQHTLFFFVYTTLPAIFVILFRIPIEKLGYYRLIQISCIFKIAIGFIVWMIGQVPVVYMIYTLTDNLIIHSISSFLDLPLSDIADKDRLLHKREKPITSMIFGTNALLTKPAISLFPMLTVKILDSYGYTDIINKVKNMKSQGLSNTVLPNNDSTPLPHAIFNMACWIPIIIGCLQLVSWYFYSMKQSHSRIGPLKIEQILDDGDDNSSKRHEDNLIKTNIA